VWKVGSFSIRSPEDSTVMVCEAAAIWRTSLRLAPTAERISKPWLNGAKPWAETLIR
jgi:hypothetical protein